MSSKRRLSGQEEEEENVSTTPEPGRKRKKLDPAQQMQVRSLPAFLLISV